MTRDAAHPLAAGIYVNNMHDLKFFVDGKQIDSKRVINYYTSPYEGKQYIEAHVLDDDGKFMKNDAGELIRVKLEGELSMEGTTSTCGCYSRRKNTWAKYVEMGMKGY